MHCEKLVEYDKQLARKEEAIAVLEKQLAALEIATHEHGVMELHTVPEHSASRERPVAAGLPSPHGSDKHTSQELSIVGRSAPITTHSPPAVEPTHLPRSVNVSGAEPDGSEPARSSFQMRVSRKPATGTTTLTNNHDQCF